MDQLQQWLELDSAETPNQKQRTLTVIRCGTNWLDTYTKSFTLQVQFLAMNIKETN
jgi:hypothetical protein